MITIWYQNTNACVIRPTPLISITSSPLKNKIGTFGSTYNITLNGTIISHDGSPFYLTSGDSASSGPDGGHDGGGFISTGPNFNDATGGGDRPDEETVPTGKRLDAILAKQNAIRQLFAQDGQKMEIQPITGDGPRITCYPSVESISFDEGVYVEICRFTVNLTASTLLDQDGKVMDDSGMFNSVGKTEAELITEYGGFIEDFNDTWSIEVDESYGNISDDVVIPRAYRVSRNVNATGRTSYIDSTPDGTPSANNVSRLDAWKQAQSFLKTHVVSSDTLSDYPSYDILGSGFLDFEAYKGYNHIRTENIDQAAGSYSISDTWLVASGDTALENYSVSLSSSTDNAFVQVSIDGSVKGMSEIPAKHYGSGLSLSDTPYSNARSKYLNISNNGQFGVGSSIYKRANNLTNQQLNSQPASISIGSNEFTGEITYNLSFNNRPVNIFTGVASETISVNDTYPGDLYAAIPVLGRATGPILQYIGGRTEYRRDISIEIILDHTDIGYGSSRSDLLLRKPSINEPIRTEIKSLIQQVSPANEVGIRKYFLSPPSESWNPKTGSYSLNLSWTYELDS
jgi:hypothetical protein